MIFILTKNLFSQETKDIIGKQLELNLSDWHKKRTERPETKERIEKLLYKFETSKSGLTEISFINVYLACKAIINSELSELPEIEFSRLRQRHKNPLAIHVNQLIKSSAEQEYKTIPKLIGIMRNNCKKFTPYLHLSYSLKLPMMRAYKAAATDSSLSSFITYLKAELEAGYWEDDSFSTTMRVLYDYFKYEFLLAQSQGFTEYPGFLVYDENTYAKRQTAIFLALYIITPFVVATGADINESLKIAQSYNIPILYQEPEEINALIKQWYDIVDLIIFPQHPSSHMGLVSSVKKKKSSYLKSLVKGSQNIDFLVNKLTSDFINKIDSLDINSLTERINDYFYATQNNHQLFVKTKWIIADFINALVKFDDINNLMLANHALVKLQDQIRQISWPELPDFSGNMDPYLRCFADLKSTWKEKIKIYCQLAKFWPIFGGEYLHTNLTILGKFLVNHSHSLHKDQLHKLLTAFARTDNEQLFRHIDELLLEINCYENEEPNSVVTEYRNKIAKEQSEPIAKIIRSTHKSEKFSLYSNSTCQKMKQYKIFIPGCAIEITKKQLANTVFFKNLSDDILYRLARMARSRAYALGTTIYKANEPSDSFAIIAKGQVTVRLPGGQTFTLDVGNTVGEMSIFAQNPTRSATVVAKSDVTVLEIAIDEFKKYIQSEPRLYEYILQQLFDKIRGVAQQNQRVFWQLAGKLNSIIVKHNISIANSGSNINRRENNIKDKNKFNKYKSEDNIIAHNKSKGYKDINKIKKHLRKSNLFSGFSNEQLKQLSQISSIKIIDKNCFLYEEGTVGDAFALIVKGELEVLKGEDCSLALLPKNHLVGEMSLFDSEAKRCANVKANKSKVTVVEIDKSKFLELISEAPDFLNSICNQLIEKIVEITKAAIDPYKKGNKWAIDNSEAFWQIAAELSLAIKEADSML